MTNNFCVLCSRKEDTLPNGEFDLEIDNYATFSICAKPECHKRLPAYIYEMMDAKANFVSIDCKGKMYKFPLDRRIINSLPSKLQLMLSGEYKHQLNGKNGRC